MGCFLCNWEVVAACKSTEIFILTPSENVIILLLPLRTFFIYFLLHQALECTGSYDFDVLFRQFKHTIVSNFLGKHTGHWRGLGGLWSLQRRICDFRSLHPPLRPPLNVDPQAVGREELWNAWAFCSLIQGILHPFVSSLNILTITISKTDGTIDRFS